MTRSAVTARGGADSPPAWGPSLATGAVALAAYLVLAPNATADKDAAEFTLVLGAGGVAHPSGYPLYTLLGHVFVTALHALGAGWAYAANAWSAVGGAVAVALLHRLGVRLMPAAAGARWATWLPIAVLGLNPVWTYEATLAETGSWHVAWAAAAALVCLRLLEGASATGSVLAAEARGNWRRGALAWGLVCGGGLAHHLTAVLLLAPLTAALVLRGGRRLLAPDLMAFAALGVALPLASYGYVAWHAFHPGPAQWPALAPTWRGVIDHVTAAQYRGYFGEFKPSPGQAGHLARYVYPLVALAAAGFVAAIRTVANGPQRTLLAAMAGACLLQVAAISAYGVPDPGSYFLPVMGLGLVPLAPAAAAWLRRAPGARTATMVAALAVVAVVAFAWVKVDWERRGLYLRHEQLLRRMWSSVTVERGFVLWYSDMWHQLRIWQVLDHEKPGLVVANPATLTHPWPREQFVAAHGFDPVADLQLPGTAGGMRHLDAGPVVQQIADRINAGTELPVIIIDMAGPSVRMLRKAPAAGSAVPQP